MSGEGLQFSKVGKFSPVQQVDDFLEGGILHEIIDRVAEIAEFTVETVHVGETGFICDDSFETFGYQ